MFTAMRLATAVATTVAVHRESSNFMLRFFYMFGFVECLIQKAVTGNLATMQ